MISLSLPGSTAAPVLREGQPNSCGEHPFSWSSLRAGVARLMARFRPLEITDVFAGRERRVLSVL
jgi:hypothetical protein